jgi:chromodomain-helicase-DNA-binding protein 7
MVSQPGESEFLVKYKNMSYLHVAWIDRVTLEADKTTRQKLLNYEKKFGNLSQEDEYFDPDYLQVDRIVAKAEKVFNGRTKISYLVKWKSLPYEETTWEDAADVNDDDKIAQYIKFSKIPKQETPVPPSPDNWIVIDESPEYKNNNLLRPYQLEGLNFLSYNWNQSQNAILADEMGLGKTVQSVSIVNYLTAQKKIRGPYLVVAPLSTIPHWKREFEGWTDLNTIVYHGSAKSREVIRKFEWNYNTSKNSNANKIYKFNVLVTTYEIIIADFSILKNIHWKYLVVDEAHRLKNKSSKLAENLKNFYYDNILLLTGTPIQNNLEELWSLLNFVDPQKFNSINQFLKEYGDMKSSEQVNNLHTILKPYLLRRMKEHVEKSIAPKEETIIEVELTTIQKKYYRAIYEKNFTFLNKGTKGNNVPSLLNIMMELRKCCNHPYLIKGVEDDITSTFRSKEDLLKSLIHCSGKMVLIDKLLPKLKEGGHKILVFSQMVKVLDLLEEYLLSKSYSFERLDGTIRGNDRQAAIDRFSKPESDRFVFLLSTRAGGLGINLTAADTVIIFDSDWNPQNDIQAQARAHRIGQKQLVKVYRLITRNTYEWQMFDRSSKKLGLDQAILTNVNSEFSDSKSSAVTRPSGLDKSVIDSLLKHGAYDLLSKDDDEASNKFCEEDIDQILERATTVVHKPGVEQESGLSSFSKASFASSTSAPELDINDPDFWRKLLPNMHDNNPLIQEAPRERKKVQRFGNDEAEDSDELESLDDQQEDEEYQEQVTQEVEKRWTAGERLRFKKCLLTLGFGRWKEIQQRARLHRWTLPQIALYGKAFIKKYIGYTNKQDKEEDVFIAIDNSDDRENTVSDTTTTTTITTAPLSLPDIINADTTVQENKDLPLTNVESVVNTTTTEENNEPSTNGATEEVSTSKSEEPAEESFESDPSLNDPVWNEYMERNAKIHLKKLIELAVLGRVIRSVEDPLKDLVLPTTSVSLADSLPNTEWSLEEDRSLMLGTYIHGYGAYEAMKNDQNLHFQKLYTQQSTTTTPTPVIAAEDQKPIELPDQVASNVPTDNMEVSSNDSTAATASTTTSDTNSATTTVTDIPPTGTESAATEATTTKEKGPRTWPTAKALNLRIKKLIRVFIMDKKQKVKSYTYSKVYIILLGKG